jgi:riboflavin synthase
MFTGIVQSLGTLRDIAETSEGVKLTVDLSGLVTGKIALGDSVAVNGACLTVTGLEQGYATFDVSSETLDKCLMGTWKSGDVVNLELALTLQTPLGGHLVSGHVDGKGIVTKILQHSEFIEMSFEVCKNIGKFIAAKGSVAVDGVSLTTNMVKDIENVSVFEVMLVPHTLECTTLGKLEQGSPVHIEVDQVARYIHRMKQSESGYE